MPAELYVAPWLDLTEVNQMDTETRQQILDKLTEEEEKLKQKFEQALREIHDAKLAVTRIREIPFEKKAIITATFAPYTQKQCAEILLEEKKGSPMTVEELASESIRRGYKNWKKTSKEIIPSLRSLLSGNKEFAKIEGGWTLTKYVRTPKAG